MKLKPTPISGLKFKEHNSVRIYAKKKSGGRRQALVGVGVDEESGKRVVLSGGNLIYAPIFHEDDVKEKIDKLTEEFGKEYVFDTEKVEHFYCFEHIHSGMLVVSTTEEKNVPQIAERLATVNWDVEIKNVSDKKHSALVDVVKSIKRDKLDY